MNLKLLARRFVLGATLSLGAQLALGNDIVKRPMVIHKLPEVGLEIWTEANPEWEVAVTRSGNRNTFSAETPGSTYPPAGMTFTLSGLKFSQAEFPRAARSAVDEAARNYGVPDGKLAGIALKPASYGAFSGYEAEFSAVADTVPVDVRVFFGHQPGKPAVAMQVFTLKGKLPHLSEQIRRSWSNVKYLQ